MNFSSTFKSVSLAALLAASVAIPAIAETPKDTFVIARNTADAITLDPAECFEFTGGRIVANLYERLFLFEPDNLTKLVGGIAESYDFSEDGKTITVKLRDGLTFHSGNPVTANDVAYSLGRAVKLNKTPAFIITQIGWTPENIADAVKAVDDSTVEIKILANMSPALVLNLLSSGVSSIVDMKEVQAHEVDGDMGYAWLKDHSAGSGPYKLKTWKANELVLLDAFEDYRHGAPAMKRVAIRHVAEPSAQRLLLEKGDVDAAMELTADQLKGLAGNPDVSAEQYPKGYLMYLAVNMENPILSKPKVREALHYIPDYDGMVGSFLDGQYKIHQNFWPGGMWAAVNDNPYKQDLAKAKALVAEAGVEPGAKITIDTLNKSPFTEVAQSVQASLKEIGIESEIILSDGKTLWPKYRARKHELIVARWGPDYSDPHSNADAFAHNPDNSFEAKLTGKLTWRNAWDAKGLTELTDQAASESDPAKREAIYATLQKMVREDSAFTVMFQAIGTFGQRSNVKGFVNGATSDQAYYRTVTK
ncbi:ABC transporter substrate-binding protein [Cohaesibacter celericrescens]|uniref:ABC transporter substrate-binding protein n=1 Tax=Cohaesibacter celericrescens TaxID=2067669 RepID=UPI0015E07407|nr:ABC transporter substrate-binding protein [Cohaesibacter celericrescens]